MNNSVSVGESKIIHSSRDIWIGDLLFRPHSGKATRRMVIQVINIPDDHTIIYVYKPSAKESSSAGSGHNHSEMGHDKSLGGELYGPSIW